MVDYIPSRFIRKTLQPGEVCIKDARFSWVYTAQAWMIWGLCAFGGYAIQYAALRYLGKYTPTPLAVGSGLGLWIFIVMMMKKWTTEIILTNERLIHKHGFFFIKVQEVDIEQLASDNVEQSLLGRFLNYGEIHIRCIEAPDIWLPPIRRPYEFRNALEHEKHEYRERYMRVERLRRHGSGSKKEEM